MFRASFQNWQPSGFLVLEAQIDYHFHPHYFQSKKGISLFLHQKLKWASLSPKKAEKYRLVAGPLAQWLEHSPLDLNRAGSNPGRVDSALHPPEVDKLSTTQ